MLRIINIDCASSCLQQLITKALLAVTEVLAQSVARDVGKYAKERWFECKKPTSTSSVSPVQVRRENAVPSGPDTSECARGKSSCSVQSPGLVVNADKVKGEQITTETSNSVTTFHTRTPTPTDIHYPLAHPPPCVHAVCYY